MVETVRSGLSTVLEPEGGLVSSAWAAETLRSYRTGWSQWRSWAKDHNAPELPADAEDVARWLGDLRRGWAPSGKHPPKQTRSAGTLGVRRAAVSHFHRLAGHPDPTSSSSVRQVLRAAARRDAAEGRSPRQARPLTAEAMAAVTAATDASTASGRLDLALGEVMRSGLLRRSEAAALVWADISAGQGGSGLLRVRRSKTDQRGAGATLFLTPVAVAAVEKIRADRPAGPSDRVFNLSANSIGRRLARMTRRAGLGDGFSGHSPRVGMAQDLAVRGAGLPELMAAGRWRSAHTVARYVEHLTAGQGAVARFFGGQDNHTITGQ